MQTAKHILGCLILALLILFCPKASMAQMTGNNFIIKPYLTATSYKTATKVKVPLMLMVENPSASEASIKGMNLNWELHEIGGEGLYKWGETELGTSINVTRNLTLWPHSSIIFNIQKTPVIDQTPIAFDLKPGRYTYNISIIDNNTKAVVTACVLAFEVAYDPTALDYSNTSFTLTIPPSANYTVEKYIVSKPTTKSSFPVGTAVNLYATPAKGYEFVTWKDLTDPSYRSLGNPTTVTMYSDRTLVPVVKRK